MTALFWACFASPRDVSGAARNNNDDNNKVGFPINKVPACGLNASDRPAAPDVLAAALRNRPEGSRWCTRAAKAMDPAEAAEARRFNACIAKKEVRYYCNKRDALELELPEGGGGVFTAMRAVIKEAFTRSDIIPTPQTEGAEPAAAAAAAAPLQPRVFFWGDSHTRLLHQTLLCLWPKAPESVFPKNKGLFMPGHLIGKFTNTAKNPVNTRNGFWHGDVIVVNQGLWFHVKPKYASEIDRFAAAVEKFRASAPEGFKLTVVWVDSTVQHFGSSSDGRYVKGSPKNSADKPGRLAPCKALPWAKLRPNGWRNTVTRRKLSPPTSTASSSAGKRAAKLADINYFRLEDFAWDLSSYHPGVRRDKSSGNYVVDCAHYCVNYGGLPHFTLLAVLHEAARGVLGEDETRGGVGAVAAAGGGSGGSGAAAAEEEEETETEPRPGLSPVVAGSVKEEPEPAPEAVTESGEEAEETGKEKKEEEEDRAAAAAEESDGEAEPSESDEEE